MLLSQKGAQYHSKPDWNKASDDQILQYKCVLNNNLKVVKIPEEAALYNNKMCNRHKEEIQNYHDAIIMALISSCDKPISVNKCTNKASKIIPGWKEYVDGYFQSSLFWHSLWLANGKPRHGIIAVLRCRTRAQYHRVHRMVLKREAEIRCDKMADAINVNPSSKPVYQQANVFRKKKAQYPNRVDNAQGECEIAELFKDKFNNLYNCVSYDKNDMDVLLNDIDSLINDKCNCCGSCIHGTHSISANDVKLAIGNLKPGKRDGSSDVVSDHIINACNSFNVHIAILFTMMIRHGISPDGMLHGTMVPIPKGRWANLSSSDNFRAITLSSMLCKLVDVIVLTKENVNLVTSNLQFSFKTGASTTLCTGMIQETISYYINNDSNVYGLMLDASKAFDCVNYCKLFRILLERNICPLYCRLLLNMYISQKLRIRWESTHSSYFNVTNGVKQGGVISPILFCVYMDGLLIELEKSNVGCYMGGVFSGAFGYADDLKLLTPSVYAMRKMAEICEIYAAKYDVIFNGKKSQLMIYKCKRARPPDPGILINNVKVPRFNEVIHLGHCLHEDIYKFSARKCVDEFNRQCNIFLANFKYANSNRRNILFQKYCTAFYGSQILPMFNNCMTEVYTAWRVVMRRVWRVPWDTHCNILPHLAGVMEPELWFSKRCIRFINMALKSENCTVKTIANMGVNGIYSIMGNNYRLLRSKYDMNENNVKGSWNVKCMNESEVIRKCGQIRELCEWRDRCCDTFLNKEECHSIIEFLCTT